MADNTQKKFPTATPEVEEMLNFSGNYSHGHDGAGHGSNPAPLGHNNPVSESASGDLDSVKDEQTGNLHKQVPLPGNLPVVDVEALAVDRSKQITSQEENMSTEPGEPENAKPSFSARSTLKANNSGRGNKNSEKPLPPEEGMPAPVLPSGKVFSFVRSALPYVGIFVVGIFLYYFYFSTFSFRFITNIFSKKTAIVATQKDTALDSLKKQQLGNYEVWMRQFYVEVTDSSILDPDADNSGNGLTNFQEYLLNLNPKVYDTLSLGMADSQTLALGINPATSKPLTEDQKKIIDTYLDLEVANNRLALEQLRKSRTSQADSLTLPQLGNFTSSAIGKVAGINIGARNAGATSAGQTFPVTIPSTQTNNPSNSPAAGADLPGALNINTSVPGVLEIPGLKISVPVIWTSDTKYFERDLKNGIVHYPGTALPGQVGTAYISGHSSNYAWVKGNYNKVFEHLDELKENQSFNITVTLKDGKKAKLHYVAVRQQEYKPDDQAQFMNTDKSQVALSTCWPVGSTARRLVVFGELTQVDR